jgi:hypothetical protein
LVGRVLCLALLSFRLALTCQAHDLTLYCNFARLSADGFSM